MITSLVTVVGGMFSIIGAGLLVVAGQRFIRRLAFIRNSSVAPGVVVAVREERDGMEAQSFRFPRVRFRTAAGRDITMESSMARGVAAWRLGDAVSVCYQIDHPETAEFDSFAALWGSTLLFALAVAFGGVGAGLLFDFIPV